MTIGDTVAGRLVRAPVQVHRDEAGVRDLDGDAINRLLDVAAQIVGTGPAPSAQLAVARNGRVMLAAAIGEATLDTHYVCFSATKPFVSSAAWHLIAAGELDPARPITDYIPSFGAFGKDTVTVEHVLLHTCGFPSATLPLRLWNDREARVAEMSRWMLDWAPGTRFEYHPTAAHWVLGELIARTAGVDHRRFVNETVLAPARVSDSWLGRPVDQQDDIATIVLGGQRGTPEETTLATGWVDPTPAEQAFTYNQGYNTPEGRAAGAPSSGLIATAAGVAKFYQALLFNPDGLWPEDIWRRGTTEVRNRIADPHLHVPANRTYGLMVMGEGRSVLRHVFGDGPSEAAFGHHGVGGQIGWADPVSGLSFGYLTNGFDADLLRLHRRRRMLCDLAAAVVPS